MKRKRTEITIEIDEIIRATGESNRLSWTRCAGCDTERAMVSPQLAAEIAGVTVRVINGWVEDGIVHFLETSDGSLLVCVNSLSQGVPSQREEAGPDSIRRSDE